MTIGRRVSPAELNPYARAAAKPPRPARKGSINALRVFLPPEKRKALEAREALERVESPP